MLALLLGFLEFLEFLMTPIGMTASIGLSFYAILHVLMINVDMNPGWVVVLALVLAPNLYDSC